MKGSILRFLICACLSQFILAKPAVATPGFGKNSPGSEHYFWPRSRGHINSYSVANVSGPPDLAKNLAWSWHHPLGRFRLVLASAPLIDDKKNLYLAGEDGIRKFTQDGEILWHRFENKELGPIASCPSLMDGVLFGNTMGGYVYGLDMETGKTIWEERVGTSVPGDTNYIEAWHGTVITGVDSFPGGGASRVVALNATNGNLIWEYKNEKPLWNFMAIFPGDGSFVTMDTNGGTYKISFTTGKLIWYTAPLYQDSFSDGNVMIGPDGVAYSCSSTTTGSAGSEGFMRAHDPETGRSLWDVVLPYPCTTWAVVNKANDLLVIPVAPLPGEVGIAKVWEWLPSTLVELLHNFAVWLGPYEQYLWFNPSLKSEVVALDPKTGRRLWSTTAVPPWTRPACGGDAEGLWDRFRLGIRPQSMTAGFGCPTLDKDGVMYVAHMDGHLYAIGDKNKDGQIDEKHEVHKFDMLSASQHPGTSFAPGMMAAAASDTMWVWKW